MSLTEETLQNLSEFACTCKKALFAEKKNFHQVKYPEDCLQQRWPVKKIGRLNSTFLNSLTRRGNVYVILTREPNDNEWNPKYVGQSVSTLLRKRMRHHLIKKSSQTGSKLCEVKAAVWGRTRDRNNICHGVSGKSAPFRRGNDHRGREKSANLEQEQSRTAIDEPSSSELTRLWNSGRRVGTSALRSSSEAACANRGEAHGTGQRSVHRGGGRRDGFASKPAEVAPVLTWNVSLPLSMTPCRI